MGCAGRLTGPPGGFGPAGGSTTVPIPTPKHDRHRPTSPSSVTETGWIPSAAPLAEMGTADRVGHARVLPAPAGLVKFGAVVALVAPPKAGVVGQANGLPVPVGAEAVQHLPRHRFDFQKVVPGGPLPAPVQYT